MWMASAEGSLGSDVDLLGGILDNGFACEFTNEVLTVFDGKWL